MPIHDRRGLTQAPRGAVAEFLLAEAQALGVRTRADGDELLMLAPVRVAPDVRRWFEARFQEYHTEIIATILRENAVRPGAAS